MVKPGNYTDFQILSDNLNITTLIKINFTIIKENFVKNYVVIRKYDNNMKHLMILRSLRFSS